MQMLNLRTIKNQSGNFTWSNGMSGQHIMIDHGGTYEVKFKPDNSPCEVTQTIVAPKSPDEFTWIFPTGCFDYCFNRKEPNAYLIGPIPSFEAYAYELDGITQGSTGSGNISDFIVSNSNGEMTWNMINT